MEIQPDILDHWSEVRSHFPATFDLEATARSRGALTRVREVKSAEALLRLALAYGACGMSLRETCAWAEAAGLARLADPSLLNRLVKAAPWLGDIVGALIADGAAQPGGRWAGYRLRALDATSICEPGADRTTWRLHVGYDLATTRVDQVELTDGRGAESLRRLAYRPGDIVLADRYYARPRDLRPVLASGADVIVRLGWNALRLLNPDGTGFDLFATLAGMAQQGEALVRVDEGTHGRSAPSEPLLLRLVMRRKDPEHAEAERRRLLKEAKKRGRKVDPRSLVAAEFILLLTSLPADKFTIADVLDLYRFRWQIELAFKRMKSLAGLDKLPAKNPDLARAWIYAKLIAFLIAERMAGQVPESSPSESGPEGRQPIALAPHQNRPRHHHRSHSRPRPMARLSTHLPALAPMPPRTAKTTS